MGRIAILLAMAAVAAAGEVSMDQLEQKTGDWWYSMNDPAGKPTGYAHLVISKTDPGGLRVAWELKINHAGNSYEEERTLILDKEWRLLAAAYKVGDNLVTDGRRIKDGWIAREGADPQEIPDDAGTGMSFVAAAFLPLEKGTVFKFTELNEAQEFKSLGETSIECMGREELRGRQVHRFLLTRQEGEPLPIWVDENHEIVQVDWGGGNLMIRSAASTKHLFKPIPPAVEEVASGRDTLVLEGHFPKLTPEEMFDCWTRPERLTKWWPPEAEIEPEVGGKYHLAWKEGDWFLEGKITAFERGKRFAFAWRWRQEPDAPERKVAVAIAAHEKGGSKLTITHGPYKEDEKEQRARAGHLQGWAQFTVRLRELSKGGK
jgi:uncharacterized protein YndB with AHSA1/START domain